MVVVIYLSELSRIYFIINERLWDPGGETKGPWKEGSKLFYEKIFGKYFR